MGKLFKNFLPSKLKAKIIAILKLRNINANYKYDKKRYIRYSSTLSKQITFESLIYKIVIAYHTIEKGLSMKNVRLGFGKSKITELLSLISQYQLMKYPENDLRYQAAISTLYSYLDYHNKLDYKLGDAKEKICGLTKNSDNGGYITIRKEDIFKDVNLDFSTFVFSRHSIRDYSSEVVNMEDIIDAIRISQKSPSACNRQSTKVHIVSSTEKKELVKSMQIGNRGFGEYTDKFIIITSDLQAYFEPEIRNQGFIDAGIFAMTLIFALHSKKYATCALNWSVDYRRDIDFRNSLAIPDNENIVLIISVGQIGDSIRVAKSFRYPTESVYTIH